MSYQISYVARTRKGEWIFDVYERSGWWARHVMGKPALRRVGRFRGAHSYRCVDSGYTTFELGLEGAFGGLSDEIEAARQRIAFAEGTF
jgi:hypothetical protein